MLQLVNVTKSYPAKGRPRAVLNGVDLTILEAQKWGILGRNGSGKSTLVRLLAGAEDPTSGHVHRLMSVSWPLAFGGGFQGGLTGFDNAKFVARIYGAPIEEVVAYVQEFAQIGRAFYEPVMTYSSGMRARLAFGLSLAIDFDALLIDEITAVGDHRFREKCQSELYEKRANKTWVLVSHDAHYVREHCSHACVIHQGKVIPTQTVDEAIAIYEALP